MDFNKQTHYIRFCYFHLFGVSLASKASNYLQLIYLVLCSVAAVKRLPVHHYSADYKSFVLWDH